MSKTAKGKCDVCGSSETVKSHIFPRALMHEMRAGDDALVAASATQRGWSMHQSGLWDSTMLCNEHEGVTGRLDDYAVGLWRAHRSLPAINGVGLRTLPNPKPDALIRFAYSIVWRWVHSRYGKRAGSNLGRYDAIIADAVFGGGSLQLPVLLFETDIRDGSDGTADIGVAPYRTKMRDRNGWLFRIGLLDCFVFTDQRRPESYVATFLAGDSDPLPIFRTSSVSLSEATNLFPLIAHANRKY